MNGRPIHERLAEFTDGELRGELRRRKPTPKPVVLESCKRCGAYCYQVRGEDRSFTIKKFIYRHRDCPAYFGGGGI